MGIAVVLPAQSAHNWCVAMTGKRARTTLWRLLMTACIFLPFCAAQSDQIPEEVRRQIPAHPPVGVSFYKIDARVEGTGKPLEEMGGIRRWIAGRGFQVAFVDPNTASSSEDRYHVGSAVYCSEDGGRTWRPFPIGSDVIHNRQNFSESYAVLGDKLYALVQADPPLVYSEACGPWVRDSSMANSKEFRGSAASLWVSNGSLWATGISTVWLRGDQANSSAWNLQLEKLIGSAATSFWPSLKLTQFNQKTCIFSRPVQCFDGRRWNDLPAVSARAAFGRLVGFKRHLVAWDGDRLARYSESTGNWQSVAPPEGALYQVWESDRDDSEIVLATSMGVVWSNDGGANFQKASEPKDGILGVYDLASFNSGLMLSTDHGLYYAVVNIPPHDPWVQVWKWAKEHLWELGGAAAILLLFIFVSTRMLLIVLSWKIKPMPEIADIFFETRFGRRRLYRAYRKKLSAELRNSPTYFVDFPFEVIRPGGDNVSHAGLSAYTREQLANKSVLVVCQAGRGKTSLCERMAYFAVRGELRSQGMRREPVVIRGTGFNGDIVKAVLAELRFRGAWVNEDIVRRQIEGKRLLLILDGISEINPDFIDGLAEQLKSMGDQTLLAVSRVEPPGELDARFRSATVIRLLDVDGATETRFFAVYTKSEEKAKRLQEEIARKFPSLPRTPLFMRVVASVFNESGQVPTSLGALFELYLSDLIARAKTKNADPDGLRFAIRELTRRTFVERQGARRGFTEERGIEILAKAGDDLKARNVTISALETLNLLTRAGIYVRNRYYFTASHDLLEDYFAALVLEQEWDNDRKADVIACQSNPKFAEVWQFLREIRPEVDFQSLQQ
jgi:hypothetical protein